MKQYTSESQTAKLIELGFAKPKSIEKITYTERYGCGYESAYSIGELIEMLPLSISSGGNPYLLNIAIGYRRTDWVVRYIGLGINDSCFNCISTSLVDVLFDSLVKLKEEGVI